MEMGQEQLRNLYGALAISEVEPISAPVEARDDRPCDQKPEKDHPRPG